VRLFSRAPSSLPVEGHLPEFGGATGWLNSEPLTPAGLRGQVVLVDFWTYTCINWLRTLAWIRAWDEKYRDDGLVVVGVHTPEFPFEHDADNVRRAVTDMRIEYPVALDNDFGVWHAFSNRYWPAVYIADADGRIRHHHFGEGGFEECEQAVQQLLRDAGHKTDEEPAAVAPEGFEVQADWSTLQSPETYLGYEQGERFASPGGASLDDPMTYAPPDELLLNQWALTGDWTVGGRASVAEETGASILFRFEARDVHLVMGPPSPEVSVPFRVLVDGEPPGAAHGFDVDEEGHGTLAQQRLHQLIREPGDVRERTFEIAFLAPGAEAYAFTFG
jgi:thiol-disulfide isomerase/thioredoxin